MHLFVRQRRNKYVGGVEKKVCGRSRREEQKYVGKVEK
jgi:hypothetical protein